MILLFLGILYWQYAILRNLISIFPTLVLIFFVNNVCIRSDDSDWSFFYVINGLMILLSDILSAFPILLILNSH